METDRSADAGTQSTQAPASRLLICLLLAAAAISLWIFRPVLANGFVDWDDQIYLVELARMGKFSWASLCWMWTSLQPFYLQPIAWMTHLADYQLWGMTGGPGITRRIGCCMAFMSRWWERWCGC